MNLKKIFCVFICLMIFVVTMGCGSYWYPERRGQTGGTLDDKVVIMDALLCLCFVIPGVIAFYIDIDGGYIYMPPGYSKGTKEDAIRIAEFSKKAKIQFLHPEGKHTFPLQIDPESNKIQNAQELQKIAKKSRECRFYYENQIVESIQLPDKQNLDFSLPNHTH